LEREKRRKAMNLRKNVMLAKPVTKDLLDRMPETVIVQPKLNGRRFLAYISGGVDERKCVLKSSQDNEIRSVPHINRAFEALDLGSWEEITFDGEFYIHGWPLQAISSVVSRDTPSHPFRGIVEAHVFDLAHYPSGAPCRLNQAERLFTVSTVLAASTMVKGALRWVPHSFAVQSQLQEVLKHWVALGYEGIVIRSPHAAYVEGRQDCILKVKPRKDDWFPIREPSRQSRRKVS